MIFLGKLNHLELWGADIGNAYLEAFTDEKLYIVADPEFQELEGYILIFLPDGTFVSQPKKYIDKLADTCKRLFNEDPPKGYKMLLDKNDHPARHL